MNLKSYISLMRLNKPIGILLLLWPTLWALWLACGGRPDFKVVLIFVLGVVLMRSAGCVINDVADRHVDGYVERTRERPLAAKKMSVFSALILFFILCLLAFMLVLFLNRLTILLAIVGAGLTVFYPYMKRFTHLPQLGLGLAFAWGVPMAFAAETGEVRMQAWLVFLAAAIWPIIYDTMYAMVDRGDDVKVGIKSTAILFGRFDVRIILLLQCLFVGLLAAVGYSFALQWPYYLGILIAGILFGYQQWLIRFRDRDMCFKAFLNNHWVGFFVFAGIFFSYWV